MFQYDFDDAMTAGCLGEKIVRDTGVALETVKLLYKDARGKSASLQPSREPDALVTRRGDEHYARKSSRALQLPVISF